MKAETPRAPSAKSFEDALLAELLVVHEELQRARPRWRSPKRARPEPRTLRRHPLRRAGSAGPGGGSGRRAGRRVVLGVLAVSAVVVLVAVALSSVRGPGQRVTIRPAAPGGLPPGTLVVAHHPDSVGTYAPGSAGDAVPGGSFVKGLNAPAFVAFDPSGDLWVANENNGGDITLVEFAKAELSKPDPSASVVITPLSVESLGAITFDQAGDLWLVNGYYDDVIEFTHSQLARSGLLRPQATISWPGFNGPTGAAFDSSGDLWVVNGTDLVEFAKADLAKPGPTPTVTISSGSIYSANVHAPIAFDASGNLWLGNWDTNSDAMPAPGTTPPRGTIIEFTKSQLAKAGDGAKPVFAVLAPAVTISPDQLGTSIEGPNLAFDPAGDLWVSDNFSNRVVEFAKGQLAKSGHPTPVRTVVGPKSGLQGPFGIAVEP
jgi:hypothetical protein